MVGRLEHPLQPPGRADALPYPLRKRSKFVVEATRKELKRIQFLQAIQEAAGAWKDEDHPDLVEKGTYQWVREQREVPKVDLKQIETGKEVQDAVN